MFDDGKIYEIGLIDGRIFYGKFIKGGQSEADFWFYKFKLVDGIIAYVNPLHVTYFCERGKF